MLKYALLKLSIIVLFLSIALLLMNGLAYATDCPPGNYEDCIPAAPSPLIPVIAGGAGGVVAVMTSPRPREQEEDPCREIKEKWDSASQNAEVLLRELTTLTNAYIAKRNEWNEKWLSAYKNAVKQLGLFGLGVAFTPELVQMKEAILHMLNVGEDWHSLVKYVGLFWDIHHEYGEAHEVYEAKEKLGEISKEIANAHREIYEAQVKLDEVTENVSYLRDSYNTCVQTQQQLNLRNRYERWVRHEGELTPEELEKVKKTDWWKEEE